MMEPPQVPPNSTAWGYRRFTGVVSSRNSGGTWLNSERSLRGVEFGISGPSSVGGAVGVLSPAVASELGLTEGFASVVTVSL